MYIGERIFVADDMVGLTVGERQTFYERIAPYKVGVKLEALVEEHLMFAWRPHDIPVPTTAAEIALVQARGAGISRIFWDAKLDANPAAVVKMVTGIAKRGVWGFTFHATMPLESIDAAVAHRGGALAIGVGALSAMSGDDAMRAFWRRDIPEVMEGFAVTLAGRGANGMICSQTAFPRLRKNGFFAPGDAFAGVAVGVRGQNDPPHDHASTMTITEAIRYGATYYVVGRAVTDAPDPIAALERIIDEGQTALSNLSQI